ncbi:MAG: ribulose-phosphate 3-epimerase [Thermoleophilia bacterium]|nr:ribulose-phosphate 3-epimerase [Thermoleophilia bacterium]
MDWREHVREVEVEPSLYAADFARLGEEVDVLLDTGARVFHWDVGDGHFVEPVTMGPIVLRAVAPRVRAQGGLVDCHLMVENPARHVPQFAEAGADSVTVHVEVDWEPARALARSRGLGFGLALNPDTPLERVLPRAGELDLVLCMSVHPGYSGQRFIAASVERAARLRELLPDRVRLQVDGGVGAENVGALRQAGADLLVAASAIFGGGDPAAGYRALASAVA